MANLQDYLDIIKEDGKDEEPKIKLPSRIVWFSHFWPKLRHPLWTTIRLDKESNYYKPGLKYQVKLGSWRKPKEAELIGICQLVSKQQISISDISDDLAYFDAGCVVGELKTQFEQWYSTQPQWKGDETKMLILFCLWVKKEVKT